MAFLVPAFFSVVLEGLDVAPVLFLAAVFSVVFFCVGFLAVAMTGLYTERATDYIVHEVKIDSAT